MPHIIVEGARPGEAFGLWRALAATQSAALGGSRLEIEVAGEGADRVIAKLLGQIEDFLTERSLDAVTLELNGNTHIVRPRADSRGASS